MINNLYSGAKRITFKIILGLIIVSFLCVECNNYFVKNNNNYVVKVNNNYISYKQLEQTIKNEYDKIQKNIGKEIIKLKNNKNFIHQVFIKIFSQMIDEILFYQYAKQLKLTINNNQIKKTILNIPDFYVNNKFNIDKFHNEIKNKGLTSKEYIELINKKLLIKKMFYELNKIYFLHPLEINHFLKDIVQIRKARLATFNITKLAFKQKVTNNEIQNNYNKHKKEYIIPKLFKVYYLHINNKTIKNLHITGNEKIHFTNNENYYNYNNKNILLNKHNNAIQNKENKINVNENNISQIDFLNKKYINIPIKIKNKKNIINCYLLQEKTININSYNKTKIVPSNEIPIELNMQETNWFNKNNIPNNLNYHKIKKTIFNSSLINNNTNTKKNNNTNLIKINNNHAYFIYTVKYKPEKIISLSKVSKKIEQQIKHQKATKQARIDAEKILINLKKNNNKKLKLIDLNFNKPKSFIFTNQNDDILTKTVFSLPKPKPGTISYGISVNLQNNIVLIALEKVNSITLNNQQKILFTKQLNKSIINVFLDTILINLRNSANVKFGTIPIFNK